VQTQFDVASIHARRGIVGGRVDDFGEHLARRVLREHPAAEMQTDAPDGGTVLIERERLVERKAAHDGEAAPGPHLLVRRGELG
jgi:hypothetical protein